MTWWEEIYDKVYVPRNEVGPGTTYAGGVILCDACCPRTFEIRNKNFNFFLTTLLNDGYKFKSHLVLCLDGEEYEYDEIRGPDKGSGFFLYTPTEHKHSTTLNGEKKFLFCAWRDETVSY